MYKFIHKILLKNDVQLKQKKAANNQPKKKAIIKFIKKEKIHIQLNPKIKIKRAKQKNMFVHMTLKKILQKKKKKKKQV